MTTTELTKKDMLLESLNELDFSNEPQFAQELRTNAKNALENLEFPTSKTEYWKYTPYIMLRHLLMHDHSHLYKIEDMGYRINI